MDKKQFIKRALYGKNMVTVTNPNAGLLGSMLGRIGLLGGLGALGLAASQAAAPVQSAAQSVSGAMGFQQMMQQSPRLQELEAGKVKQMYDVLHQFAPDVASNPVAAAGIVENLAQYDTVDHRTVADLISMQKGFSETHRGQRREAPFLGSRMLDLASKMLAV